MELNRYDQATVGLWTRGHAELADRGREYYLACVAVHAVLAGLRRWDERETFFASYERDPDADFALIGSLLVLANDPTSELLWKVRDAAYFLRWRELRGECI